MPNSGFEENKVASRSYIFLACPWTPKGGGMFKVADYLIQAQSSSATVDSAELKPLDTRGGASALSSSWVLVGALFKLVKGRLNGELAGVHVNMAERLSLIRKGILIAACRALGISVILHLHAAQLHHFYKQLPKTFQAITRWVFSLPTCVIVLGETSKRFVIAELGVAAERVEIVINGVPEPREHRRIKSPNTLQQIFFLGNLSERKGLTDLLEALALPGFDRKKLRVVLAGGGDVSGYQTKAKSLGLSEFVHFEGWTEQKRAAQIMMESDVLVLPSYDEGLPLVILEALACGVAVVCSPVGEIPSVLTHGLNACFVEPGDVSNLALTLQRVLKDAELMEELGRNGRELYERSFSMQRFFASIALIHKQHFGIAAQSAFSAKADAEYA
jgi:glycosyltransferase involved in cell wall biosynthesis